MSTIPHVVLVVTIAGWSGILAVLSGGKERLPRLAILVSDLLSGGRAKNADILSAVVGGVPHALATDEVLATFVGEFVLQPAEVSNRLWSSRSSCVERGRTTDVLVRLTITDIYIGAFDRFLNINNATEHRHLAHTEREREIIRR